MRIILTADDFGHCEDTVAATVACFGRGALTSASIMVNMPASPQALAFAAAHTEHSYGVHLTLAGDGAERPVSDPAAVAALVDSEGRFLSARQIRVRALLGLLPIGQIEREMAAQLARAADHGVALSYVDSHKHLHKLAPVRTALERVLPSFGIRRVRNVQDIYLRKPLRSPTFWLGALWRRQLMQRFATTDHFYMPTSGQDEGWPEPLLARLPAGATVEVAGHPGAREDWRAGEARELCRFAQIAGAQGHTLIGWRDL